ncbi:creatininase family protein [Planctomycetota bacterium]
MSQRKINEWDLASTNLGRIRKRNYEVAVLPIAAIEAHNRHLPQGQDYFHTTYIAKRCCEQAWPKTESVIALPALPYGVDCNLSDFPLTIHVSQMVLDAMVTEIITSLRKHNIRKIVILNGHGGNDFKPLVRQIQSDMDVFVFLCDWWKVGQDKYDEIFTRPDDHAGQMETSVAMHLYPELVETDSAGDGKAKDFRFEALQKGWLSTSRNFAKLNDHCAVGDPSGASPEKGKAYINLACDRISQFLIELATTKIDENFPYKP